MRTIAAEKFKQRCLRLVDEVQISGEPIVITKRGRPVAQLAPLPAASGSDWAGAMAGRGSIDRDLVTAAGSPHDWEVLRG
jgi:prevent-host-death family protein